MADDFEYDVAFSFVAEDEALALRVAELLKDRYSTFVYSEQQKNLAGRDGEEAFAAVFAKKARVVVVLYREKWGNTVWTRIEQDAIRGRAYDSGYGFTLFVPLDEKPSVPVWLPKTRLWYSLARFGEQGLAATVEQLIREHGGEHTVETLEMRSERLGREVALGEARKDFIEGNDHANGRAARDSAIAISDAIVAWAEQAKTIRLDVKRSGSTALLLTYPRHPRAPACLLVTWSQPYTNHIGPKARFTATLFEGTPEFPGIFIMDEPTEKAKLSLRPDLRTDFELCWISDKGGPELSAELAADAVIRFFLDGIAKLANRK